MNRMYLVMGDWSNDGHGKSDKILVEVNKTVKEVQDAYKASCKLTGISFNHNEDFTGIKRDYDEAVDHHIFTEYEGCHVSQTCIDILAKYGIEIDEDEGYCPEDFAELWFKFVKLSLPDLEFNFVKDDIPCINGYWNSNLNVQFGYGLYL